MSIIVLLTDAQWTALEKEAEVENSKMASVMTKQIEILTNEIIVKHRFNEPKN
ncbi:hypothetical protein HQN88_13770 [Paenibacillus qinlingensis]|nr:hypothetical protein [Paenibacillus qinlingensis]